MIKYLLLILAYIIGSIPFGLIIGKLKGIDIREHGSKNIGSTNVARVLGFKYGLIVFLCDSLKGALFVGLFTLNILPTEYLFESPIMYGLAATLGHSFSIFLKFKGGKAVATTAGVLGAYDPILLVISLLVFYLTVKITKYVSLGSLLGAGTSLVISITFSFLDVYQNLYRYDYNKIYFPLGTLALSLLILLRHRKNIEKLKNQTENKFEIK